MFRLLTKTLLFAGLSSGPRAFLKKMRPSTVVSFRQFLLALALIWVALPVPVLLTALLSWLFVSLGGSAWLPRLLGEGDLAFLLTDNQISGVFFGLIMAGLLTLATRRIWLTLLLTMTLLASGYLALNVGWGCWMGLGLGFLLHQTIVYRGRPLLRKMLRIRTLIYLFSLILVFYFSDSLANLVRSLQSPFDFVSSRALQWGAAGLLTFGLDLALAMGFFHFYYAQNGDQHEKLVDRA